MAAMIGSSAGSCLSGALSIVCTLILILCIDDVLFLVFVWFQLRLWPRAPVLLFGSELVTYMLLTCSYMYCWMGILAAGRTAILLRLHLFMMYIYRELPFIQELNTTFPFVRGGNPVLYRGRGRDSSTRTQDQGFV